MAGLKTVEANAILNRTLGVSPSESRQIRLYTVMPTATAAGTEVSGGSYAPQTITFDTASGGATQNSGSITFPAATGSWGTVVGWAVTDGSGVQKTFRALSPTMPINTGDVARWAAGDLDVTLG